MVQKLYLKKELKHLYAPSATTVVIVNAPNISFIMADGQIEPGETPEHSAAFREAMMASYGLSFALKFMSQLRKQDPIDYTVMAAEGLWWMNGVLESTRTALPAGWGKTDRLRPCRSAAPP